MKTLILSTSEMLRTCAWSITSKEIQFKEEKKKFIDRHLKGDPGRAQR